MKINRFTLLLAAAVTLTATAASGAIVYRQGFSNDSGGFKQSHEYEWRWFFNHATTNAVIEGTTTSSRLDYRTGSTAVENINAASPYGDNIAQGFWTMNTNSNQLAFTELSIPRSYTNIAVSYDQNNNTSDSSWHVALRFGNDGPWFVSDASSNIQGGWGTFSLDVTDASLWTALVFESEEFLERADPDNTVTFDSIAGDITAVGFFGQINNASATTHRLDNFTVYAVPEPAHIALALGALALGLVLRRRGRA